MEAWREELYHSELYHHGILGMKWGIRNGPPYPLYYNAHSPDEFREGWKKSLDGGYNARLYGRRSARGYRSVYANGQRDARYYTHGNGGALNGRRTRAGYTVRYEDRQKRRPLSSSSSSGYDPDKAKRTKMILAAVGGASLAAAALYFKNKKAQNFTDSYIKAGHTISNVSGNKVRNTEGAFFAANHGLDRFKYQGVLGSQLRLGLLGNKPAKDVYVHTIKANRNLKVSSVEHSKQAFQDLIKNDANFRKAALEHVRDRGLKTFTPRQKAAMKQAAKDIERGKITDLGYAGFNQSLTNHKSKNYEKVTKTFYDEMKNRGYDAIHDLNDSRLSVYHTKRPMIVFGGKDSVSVVKSRKTSRLEDFGKGIAGVSAMTAQEAARYAPAGVAAVGGALAIKKAKHDYKYMSGEERAEKRNKALGIAAGAALGAAAVGGILAWRKYGKTYTNEVIKAGTTIQTVSSDADRLSKGRQIYTNYKNVDIKAYEGQFGVSRKEDVEKGADLFKKRIRVKLNKDVAVADRDIASREFYKMMKKDTNFRNEVNELSRELAKSDINKRYHYRGKYDKFNTMILPLDDSTDVGKRAQPLIDKYYDALKKKGYGAIEDAKDRRYSTSIRSRSAVMLFDKSAFGETAIDSLDAKTVAKGKAIATKNTAQIKLYQAATTTRNQAAVTALAGMGIGAGTAAVVTEKDKKAVSDYRKAHPNTRLSYDEILAMQNGNMTVTQKQQRERKREINAILKYRQDHPYSKLSDAEILRLVMKR